MREIINKELATLDKNICRYEGRLEDELKQFRKDMSKLNVYDILNFTESKLKRLRDYHYELEKLKEQKELLEYVLLKESE
ncbi:hypothetical protein [Terrisporobacter sp.]|uniref:hypothetical protein n=1 Tax=Terrisporobacter sp. TaxID=1965305 RepID=UPI00260E6761|nr:hypothetical protein [Terrisporobacter sp.]